jgi:hypothetical protein
MSAMTVVDTGTASHVAAAMRRLRFGMNLAADAVVLTSFAYFLTQLGSVPRPAFSACAWTILLALVVTMQLVRWWRTSRAGFPVFLAGLVVVVALDLIGEWPLAPATPGPAAAIAAGGGLLLWATVRPQRDIVIATAALAAVILVAAVIGTWSDSPFLAARLLQIALAGLPPLLGASIAAEFRRMVKVQSDRAQVQTLVATPGLAVGMLASEQLRRLDLDAEKLLDGVATGRIALPLDARTADRAASLATELRLHLIAGRRETWLYHAISESAVLGPVVTVTDADGLAAMLAPGQRDGLMSAIWLLAGEPARPGQSARISISRPDAAVRRVAIAIELSGVPRAQVDPSAWQAIEKVGRFSERMTGAALAIDIECMLEGSIDHQGV